MNVHRAPEKGVESGNTLSKIPISALNKFWLDPKLRRSSRFYFFIREFFPEGYHKNDPWKRQYLLQFFTPHEIRVYLDILVRRHLMRRSHDGHYHIVSLRNHAPVLFSPRTGKTISQKHTSIPEDAIKDKKAWMDYLGGTVTFSIADDLARIRKAKEHSHPHAVKNEVRIFQIKGRSVTGDYLAELRMRQDLALSIISTRHGVHKSTASRTRKRGERAGLYELVRQYRSISHWFTKGQLAGTEMWPDIGIPRATVVWRGRRQVQELPTQVIAAKIPFFYA